MLDSKLFRNVQRACRAGVACAAIGLMALVAGCPALQECQTDADCDDVLFCNGEEFCLDGVCARTASLPCGEGGVCDEEADACVAIPQGFLDADAVRGGTLYDKWWAVAGMEEPTDDHPLWATQDTNTRTGADTWRCKECHGWDYKGVDGVYGSGSHMTGFAGIFGTTLSAQEVFDLIQTGHGFGDAGLSADDIWDLAKFVLEGQIDTDAIIEAGGAFTGSAATGQTLYESGIDTNEACMVCHGAEGLLAPPGADPAYEDFVGLIANDNAWEFQHKVRFGQPGETMPSSVAGGGATQDVADLGAYAQTLPTEPGGEAGDPAAGQAFYEANNCALCHGANAEGTIIGEALVGEEAGTILDQLSAGTDHTGEAVDGVTQEDADNLAAWLGSL